MNFCPSQFRPSCAGSYAFLGHRTELPLIRGHLHLGTFDRRAAGLYKDIIALFRHPLGKTMRLWSSPPYPPVIATLLLIISSRKHLAAGFFLLVSYHRCLVVHSGAKTGTLSQKNIAK